MTRRAQSARLILFVMALLFLMAAAPLLAVAQNNQPVGPDFTFNQTLNATQRPATELTTAGGTITTMNLNGTMQNPHWKGFVGNVSGRLALQDASKNSLYEWEYATISGEVYVSRNESVEWSNIVCANAGNVSAEETALSHNNSAIDSISTTFNEPGSHPSFSTANVTFGFDQCNYTTNLFVNSTSQSSTFYEVLLSDTTNIIYTAILENESRGFDDADYDFQMIVPENGSSSFGTSTTYYFYVELL